MGSVFFLPDSLNAAALFREQARKAATSELRAYYLFLAYVANKAAKDAVDKKSILRADDPA